ncbi:conserved hypothetical protein [Aspergillus terreus NIH2624]|uniref:Sld7 C-terminal domain-containing protein n=1 Tax=Aspergillus terreus (strain NIH 2624 / FGSC A1156) TaxID=341663 RepID=Q0CH72_ASPTN|nr:uncharacterized protein ATEG_06970 [Aspergillus terreus NIH2624]EAU32354.1 conserved hypothetical protein [Aspergillus terreus NIH2624]
MNVWSGAIALNGASRLQGLQLIDRSSNWQSDIPRGATLSLRSFVNPALIPLFARVGPNLELHASDPETQQWLKNKLLGTLWVEEEDLDRFQTIQSPVGFLVNANSASRTKTSGSSTTDLLIYGILSNGTSIERPPTPPESCSPSSDNPLHNGLKQELRIYAAPLSSSLITKAHALPTPENVQEQGEEGQYAQFLPDLRSPSPKRKRVATLFESVAQHHKRVRQKGGEAVSQLMAHSLSQSQQLQTFRIKREPEDLGLPSSNRITSHRARSLSVGTNLHPSKPLELRTDPSRPSSNRSHTREFASRRNTPSFAMETASKKDRKEREFSPALPSSDGKLELSSSPKDAESIILDNKNTITRTILTCMRLYGFNRPSTRSSNKGHVDPQETAPTNTEDRMMTDSVPPGNSSSTDEDEFKSMYHATYRASTFALRKYLKEPACDEGALKSLPPVLEKGKAMTYIDEFLRLFCEEN